MNALVINCSPVRNGATVEIYGHMEIESCGSIGLCSVENKSDVENIRLRSKDFVVR